MQPNPGARRHKGAAQAMVELAIVLPVLLTLILGLISIGQLLLANYTVSQAARAAAHQAALAGGADDAAYSAAESVIESGIGTRYANAEVQVRCDRTPCRRYDPVTVAVAYHDEFWAPLPFFSRFNLMASATRAAERDQQ